MVLQSHYIRVLDNDGQLELRDLHPGLKAVLDVAKEKIKEHCRARRAELSTAIVQQWKREKVYPYEGRPKSIVEKTERQVFDVLGLTLHEFLPDFEAADPRSKRLALSLLKVALQSSPSSLRHILGEVLDLPKEKQDDFARLLKRTTLSAIISASKIVADRVDFLGDMSNLVFDKEIKKHVLERRQLHRIIADQTWLFGEEYNLTVDDGPLTEVLQRHRQLIGDEIEILSPVLREDGSEGVIDLMLSRLVPQSSPEERQHLVIELKRPTVSVDEKAAAQIKSYAFAIADDQRFKNTKTRWDFWVVSNEITPSVQRQARQPNRAPGLLHDDPDTHLCIWVKTWGQLIQAAEGRLKFFQKQLNYTAGLDPTLAYLRKTYARYLPDAVMALDSRNQAD